MNIIKLIINNVFDIEQYFCIIAYRIKLIVFRRVNI